MQTIEHIDLISSDPVVRNGRPCIAGSGIEVAVIAVQATAHGRTPEQIAKDYRLSLAQVHAALSYYYLHPNRMDALLADYQHQVTEYVGDQVGSRHPPLP